MIEKRKYWYGSQFVLIGRESPLVADSFASRLHAWNSASSPTEQTPDPIDNHSSCSSLSRLDALPSLSTNFVLCDGISTATYVKTRPPTVDLPGSLLSFSCSSRLCWRARVRFGGGRLLGSIVLHMCFDKVACSQSTTKGQLTRQSRGRDDPG